MSTDERSAVEILRDSLDALQSLFRAEARLALIEVRQEAIKLKTVSAWLGVGVCSGLFALSFLLMAGVHALALYVPMWAAALTFALVLGLVAFLTLAYGKKRLSDVRLVPRQVQQLKENVQWTKQHN
jgi:hypothetical protein